MKKFFLSIAIVSTFFTSRSWSLTPDQILAKADAVRNPQIDYTVNVKVTSTRPNKSPSVYTYTALIKGRDKSVVKTVSPEVDRGRILLMNGSNFWGYLPNVSKPLRISLQERLVGEVANGDLARTNFSGDYDIISSKEVVEKGEKLHVLDLKAKTEDITYGRVVIWIRQGSYQPVRAEFYAFSGRLLKNCEYGGYKSLGGGTRPTQLTLRDAVNKDQYSVLIYSDMVVAPLPDKYFNKDAMKRFTAE